MNEGQIVKQRTLRSDTMFELALDQIKKAGYKCYTEAIYEAVYSKANEILKSENFPTMAVMNRRFNDELDNLEKVCGVRKA